MTAKPDSATPFDGRAYAKSLATKPGVYRMLDGGGAVLYVGKAKDLRKRVGSYFQRPQLEPRIARMLGQVAAVEVAITRTEAEALLLENELIKSLKPRYNILLRDAKSFPYIYLSTKQEFPRLGFHRGARDQPGRYFGPFPSAGAVRESLNQLHRVFRVRGCEDSFFKNRSRPCLQYQIGRCTAPCVGLVDAGHYRQDVHHLELFLEGKTSLVLDDLGQLMDQASAALEFERAARLRDEIAQVKQTQARQAVAGIEQDADVLACRIEEGVACVQLLYFRNGMNLGTRSFFPRLPPGEVGEAEVLGAFLGQYYLERPPPPLILLSHAPEDRDLLAAMLGERREGKVELRVGVRGDRARLVEMVAANAENALATELAGQQSQSERWQALANLLCDGKPPEQVECFDISHTQGEAAVASCVVFGPEGPRKSLYRRYNLRTVKPGDDYGAMFEALSRRLRHAAEGEAKVPDLLLIDGGAGQVNAVCQALKQLSVTGIRIVGVAKGAERRVGYEALIRADTGEVLRPDAHDPGFHMVQRIRDEAHRFAIGGHRGRRERARERSVLQDVPGVGAKRRSALLRHFGGMAGVLKAGVEELRQVPGIHEELAARIHATLHGGG